MMGHTMWSRTGTTLGLGWLMHSTMVKESAGQQSSACVLNNAHKFGLVNV